MQTHFMVTVAFELPVILTKCKMHFNYSVTKNEVFTGKSQTKAKVLVTYQLNHTKVSYFPIKSECSRLINLFIHNFVDKHSLE